MSSLAKCRRVKRPTTLAKRSQLAKKNFYEKRSYKPLCEKLKGNNNALAKALSKEKQESQYLLSQNLALTSEVQELGVACNKRDDIISVVLKNAKDTLALLVTLTSHVTNTIACCQQVVTTTRYTPRKSTTVERRESTRRSSGKSPARGVVQPMVGGHTITKPTINLSRLNIQREYRIQNPPNLSDIEEVLTPEQSPSSDQTSSSVRLPMSRALNCVPRRVDRMPERLQSSLRTSDESERRSSVRSNRNSGRNSSRRSRRDSDDARADAQNDERLKSPRVSLHDVSRLLQNAQSVNIRTLLESSNEGEMSESDQASNVTPENSSIACAEQSPEVATTRSESLQCERTSPCFGDELRNKRDNSAVISEAEDPLEGPSWLLNDCEVAPSLDDAVTARSNDLSPIEARGNKRERKIRPSNGNSKNHRAFKDSKIEDRNHEQEGGEEENGRDDDETVNLAKRWIDPRGKNFYQNLNDEDDRTETILPNFVTRKRGSHSDDTQDFTLMWRGPTATNRHFDLNDLELPVIDSPLRKQPEVRPPEPELTANIQRITTQNFGNLTAFPPANNNENADDTIADSAKLPILPDNEITLGSSLVEQNERSDDEPEFDDNDDTIVVRARKKPRKKRPMALESSNDSDWTPTPKRKNLKAQRKDNGKDPSSAKVVLQKLKDDRIGKLSLTSDALNSPGNHDNRVSQSNGTSTYRERSSDSEASSNASSNNFVINAEVHGRPRRQKAPMNLKEPSLGKKLRRH